jgi:hypothetical protein
LVEAADQQGAGLKQIVVVCERPPDSISAGQGPSIEGCKHINTPAGSRPAKHHDQKKAAG